LKTKEGDTVSDETPKWCVSDGLVSATRINV
jgi:hypothetical protein